MALVAVRGLNKTYVVGSQHIHVLRDLELEVAAGEMVAVVGASGVGKSTLLHLLGGLDRADSGVVQAAGVELTQLPDGELVAFRNRSVGFVFQFHHLLPEFTAAENVEMPMRIAKLPHEESRRRAADLLARVGLSERVTHRPGMLSGGEQQRVALARALVLEPRLLLTDEPTGNLDTHTGEEIHALLVELNRERGMTMVVVTHNADLAGRMPRRVRMVDGLIGEDGAGPRAPSAELRGSP